MKNWQKISLTIITIFIFIVVGLSLLVKSYLVPETIEVYIIPKLEEIIKHKISFKKIEVGLTGTIKLKNISIYDPTRQKESIFFQSQDMVLHCQLLPLLLKKIIIDEITLHQANIDLTRDKQGNYNFIKDAPETAKKASDKIKADNVPSKTSLSFIVTRLNIKNGKLTFTDYLKTPSKPFQLTVRNINVHASDISPISPFPINLSAEIVSTPLSFLKLKGSIDPLRKEAKSKVQLAPLDIIYFSPYFPDLPFTLLEGFCSLDLNITASRSLDFSSQGLISLKDLTISSVRTSDDDLPDTFTGNLRNITLDLDHRLSYKADSGTLLLEKCDATIQETKLSLNGQILFNSPDEITIDHLKTTLKESSLTLKGKINHYPDEPLTAEFQLTSPAIVIDDIISCLEEVKDRGERAQEEEEKKDDDESEEMEPLNLKGVKIKTDISLGSIIYKNLHISDLKARCRLDDNIFNLESLEGSSEGGSFKLKGRSNLAVKGLDYNLQFTGNDLHLNPIITSFAPDLQENIHGIADLTVDLRGSGTTSETFKKHLKGKGKIYIKDGEISGLEFLQSFASFIKVEKLDTLSFDQSQGTFKITEGVVHTKNSLKGKEIELYPEGTISLNSYLDLSMEMKISPKLSEQIATSALTKYFKDERGWTVIALAIKGPKGEISVIPASSTIQNISEMITDILLKKEDVDSDKRQDKKKALEDLIKGLIKKTNEDKKGQLE